MKKCTLCQREWPDEYQMCPICGKLLSKMQPDARRCSNCGNILDDLPEGARFCPSCGSELDNEDDFDLDYLLQEAKQGDCYAQYDLSVAYRDGNHVVAKDERKSIRWLTESAKNGHFQARLDLGEYYMNGPYKDEEKAASWFAGAAILGWQDEAREKLSELGSFGEVYLDLIDKHYELEIPSDYIERALSEDAESMYRIGRIIYFGSGIDEKSEEEKIEWNLGFGCKFKSAKYGVFWFAKALLEGHAEASYELGIAYYYGYGVQKNEEEAVKYFKYAESLGSTRAKTKLQILGY